MNSPLPIEIKKAHQLDQWKSIREICCLTGNGGEPIAAERWPFFADLWVGPYQDLPQGIGYVAYQGPQIVGYLTGCTHTLRFERQKKWIADPYLAAKVLLGRHLKNSDSERFLKRFLGKENGPEQSFPVEFLKKLKQDFPAHLHTNVLACARGLGLGQALIAEFKSDLLRQGVPGVHLFCGEGPIPFYQKQGFEVLHRIEFKGKVPVYALGSRT